MLNLLNDGEDMKVYTSSPMDLGNSSILNQSSPDSLFLLSDRVCMKTLHLESTLSALSLYDYQVNAEVRGREVAETFNANPLLPGVILLGEGELVGMISRGRFFEQLSRPYGLELFLKRQIQVLYRFTQIEYLRFKSSVTIVAAVQGVLSRSPDLLYEPIVVEIAPGTYRLLDVHQLLLAHAHIHELATELLQKLYQQLEVANQELHRQATLDGLTQVANRRMFDRYLSQQWDRLTEEKKPLSLLLCDIDFFKGYNDAYGHQAGDHCLQQVARVLKECGSRREDLVARYGGEEFAVILPNTFADGAIAVASRIRKALATLHLPHRNSTVCDRITLSIGIATVIPTKHDSLERLIASSDQALYRAKQEGRDCSICHEN
ncbi:GGDEF domain-containing protein [Laspinema olomoucense]|uniref:GGDEF domain-containing protein n=1 Tax=Laspinema olomoucense D3b TaxID=2953688 RepID=A0ABT2N9G1_9CYAN|nr:GGDEF domain-containing protein [Laspinema sp. D3b]MCT7979333.1 GGDEF domain-containing protein [Laspinema sp. D3b]